jgi:hypothetical protein
MTGHFEGYPLVSFTQNIQDGWGCLIGKKPHHDDDLDDADYVVDNFSCSNNIYVVLGYVLSTIFVVACINRVFQLSSKSIGRMTSAAILLAYAVLLAREMIFPIIHQENVSSVFVDAIALMLLISGMEIYGRESEPENEMITEFS